MRPLSSTRFETLLSLALIVATFVGLGYLARARDSFGHFSGDEPTYVRMAESLVRDGDLEFDEADRSRLKAAAPGTAGAVILQESGDRLTYSKPAAHSVLAAPFFWLGGEYGLVALNLLALLLAGWAALRLLRSRLTLVTYLCAGAVLPYVFWLTSDFLQFAVILAGSSLCAAAIRNRTPEEAGSRGLASKGLMLGGVLLGLAVAMRITNLPLAIAPVLAAGACGSSKKATRIAVPLVVVAALGMTLNFSLSGSISPYLAKRASFDKQTPVAEAETPAPEARAAVEQRFDRALATVRIREVRPAVTAYSAVYFFVGRHSGLLLYFPVALLLIPGLVRWGDRVSACLGLGAVVVVFAYLIFLPHNYFGGGSCIGNRYFLPVYGALLPAVAAPVGRRWLLGPWLMAAAVFVSALVSIDRSGEAAGSTQSHAYGGIFRLFPYESTAENLEGHAERHWRRPGVARGDSDFGRRWDFVRFVDPFSIVKAQSLVLEAGRPPAELLVARRDSGGVMKFLVRSSESELTLRYRDRGKNELISVPPAGRGARVVEIVPSRAWRRHPYWFYWELDSTFVSQSFRLALESPGGAGVTAELHYLADGGLPTKMFRRKVLAAKIPEQATAGRVSRLKVRVRNKSQVTWATEAVVPVFLSYKLTRAGDPDAVVLEGPRTPLARSVAPEAVLSTRLAVRWPDEPGTYRLEIDLVAEGVAWFASRFGEPLVTSEVTVTASGS